MENRIGDERLVEITKKIEMEWKESLFGIIAILNELNNDERRALLNKVSEFGGKNVQIPQDIQLIIDFSVNYLASKGIDVSRKPGLQIMNPDSNINSGLYERVEAMAEKYKTGRR